tara:strand:- start:84 stop:236 length:153 start_codon:yes stop_codon:yes gene_type:complete
MFPKIQYKNNNIILLYESPDVLKKEFKFLVMVYKICEMGKKTILFLQHGK